MQRSKKIAVILPDTLQYLGVESVLDNYFPAMELTYYATFRELSRKPSKDSFDYFITDDATFLVNIDYFLPRRGKVIVLYSKGDAPSLPTHLISTLLPLEELIDHFERWFATDESSTTQVESAKGLSAREINVIQQIVKGHTNKEIADNLHISLNTVLSHRKNITAKLGIKTVSGLTFYAIMNGLVPMEDCK